MRFLVVPSYAGSLALLKPFHKSSSSNYYLLFSALLYLVVYSSQCAFFMRKNSFWLGFRAWFQCVSFQAVPEKQTLLRTNKYKRQDKDYEKCTRKQTILTWSHFLLSILFSTAPVTSADCLPRVLCEFFICGFTILIFHFKNMESHQILSWS